MDDETLRINSWSGKFFEFLKKDNVDLIPLYQGRLMYLPQQDENNSINPALNELDERYATPDQIKRMWDVLENYASEHPV